MIVSFVFDLVGAFSVYFLISFHARYQCLPFDTRDALSGEDGKGNELSSRAAVSLAITKKCPSIMLSPHDHRTPASRPNAGDAALLSNFVYCCRNNVYER